MCVFLLPLLVVFVSCSVSSPLQLCKNGVSNDAGRWMTWSSWSECTKERYCLSGVQTRHRVCSQPWHCCFGIYREQQSCPKKNCKQLAPTINSTFLSAPLSSFISQECDSDVKYLASSEKKRMISGYIWKALQSSKKHFTSSYFNVKQYPASKDPDGPKFVTKACFEPSALTWKSVKHLFGLNRIYGASYYMPRGVKPDDNVVGVAIGIEKPGGQVVAMYAAVQSPFVGYKVVGVVRWKGQGYDDAL